ncbi:unnamed protein product [Clonostachys chloroleuca]|uniref:Uncharacterized protein n=1 Tax=Clonostachys chloroleuca TaxID=1926264 RepID=A0AA35LT83_9HYPO|nr:unnamed protein product [Clonostachys chloroleuca]
MSLSTIVQPLATEQDIFPDETSPEGGHDELMSVQNSDSLRGNKGGELIQDTIRNIKLLPFAIILCCLGLFGIVFLWIKFRTNYIWLMGHLFFINCHQYLSESGWVSL